VNEQNAFLKALEENEDDTVTRLVYADWLDENGEHDEADRQRKWPAAKEWFIRFCQRHNPGPDDDEYSYVCVISYKDLIVLGREAIEETDEEEFGFNCWNNMTMCDALEAHSDEFWKNWSIVTGIPLPPDIEDKGYFRCAC
jgi:uncharacterized protein (TIGR02996 family)